MMKNVFTPIRLVLADDHEIFRDGFRALLSNHEHIALVGEAGDGLELLEVVDRLQPDVVITDMRMPNLDGLEATRLILQRYPHISVIGLSVFEDEGLILDMLEAGARGYLLKSVEKEQIIQAITHVHTDPNFVCGSTTEKLIRIMGHHYFTAHIKSKRTSFNEREISIIQLICEGLSSKEIGDRLYLSHRTIEGYRETIQQKMKVRNTAGVVVYAITRGIYKVHDLAVAERLK